MSKNKGGYGPPLMLTLGAGMAGVGLGMLASGSESFAIMLVVAGATLGGGAYRDINQVYAERADRIDAQKKQPPGAEPPG